MRVGMGRTAAACSAALLASACGSSTTSLPSPSAEPKTVMLYRMDEGAAASVMKDSGRAGVHGRIGADVAPGVKFGSATVYRFAAVDPRTTTVRPGHLVTIRDSPALDVGDAPYSVEIRYRTVQANGANLIQKGQATSPGGQFKIQVPEGNPQCYYKGSRGKVGATWRTKINDGQWHTLRCAKTGTSVSLYVDGVLRKRHTGEVGTIDNDFPMTIGGKPSCDMVKVQCDYFGGMIDYVKVTKG